MNTITDFLFLDFPSTRCGNVSPRLRNVHVILLATFAPRRTINAQQGTSTFHHIPCFERANTRDMSPSSSAAAMPSHVRARGSSNATPVPVPSSPIRASRTGSPNRPLRTSSRPGSPAEPSSAPAPHYTVFIRFPFARGDFQDPAPTNWTAAKDRQLWKLISKSHSGDLDWAGLSQQFDVELNFLLMQAAWLSERHMERMRRQVTRIGGGVAGDTGSGTGSSVGGVKMERTASRGTFTLHADFTGKEKLTLARIKAAVRISHHSRSTR